MPDLLYNAAYCGIVVLMRLPVGVRMTFSGMAGNLSRGRAQFLFTVVEYMFNDVEYMFNDVEYIAIVGV